jgi:hypothetical protein
MTDTTVTVALIPQAAEALETTAALTGMSRADVINRALQLYAFAEFERAAGAEILLRRDGETSRLEITVAPETGAS